MHGREQDSACAITVSTLVGEERAARELSGGLDALCSREWMAESVSARCRLGIHCFLLRSTAVRLLRNWASFSASSVVSESGSCRTSSMLDFEVLNSGMLRSALSWCRVGVLPPDPEIGVGGVPLGARPAGMP